MLADVGGAAQGCPSMGSRLTPFVKNRHIAPRLKSPCRSSLAGQLILSSYLTDIATDGTVGPALD
jgi:hypothetical protein